MFSITELEQLQEVINNGVALKPITPELFASMASLTNRIDQEKQALLRSADDERVQGEADIVLVCQDCGEAFDDLDPASDHACREDYTEDEAADQWRTSIRAAQF